MSKENTIFRSGWQRHGDGSPDSGPVVHLERLAHVEDQCETPPFVDADGDEDENGESPHTHELTPEQEAFEVFTPKWLLPGMYPKD